MSRRHLVVDPTDNTAVAKTDESAATGAEDGAAEKTDDVPEKFKDKSLTEVIDMYQNLETELGRQKNEIGTYRNLVTELSEAKRSSDLEKAGQSDDSSNETPVEVTAEQLLENPSDVLTQVVASTVKEELAPILERLNQNDTNSAAQQFADDFPDYQDTFNDPEFHTWVNAKPSRVIDGQATLNGDVHAARRLLENYQDVVEARGQSSDNDDDAGDDDAATDTTPTGVDGARKVATDTPGQGGDISGKKIWTSAEIVDMQLKEPEKYKSAAIQEEIVAAIKEGRYRQ